MTPTGTRCRASGQLSLNKPMLISIYITFSEKWVLGGHLDMLRAESPTACNL